MRIWLVQRAESTPHDDDGKRRIMRTGILAQMLADKGHEVVWWTSAFDHSGKRFRFKESRRLTVCKGYQIQYIETRGYKRNISLDRYRDGNELVRNFNKLVRQDPELPDLILASLPSVELADASVAFANSINCPVILDIRDLYPDVFLDLMPRILRPIGRLLLQPMQQRLKRATANATAIHGLTDEFVDWALKAAERPRKDRDQTIYMAYNQQLIEPKQANLAKQFWEDRGFSSSNEDRDGLNCVFFGAFSGSFDLKLIFDAAKRLATNGSKTRFVFCGAGKQEALVKKECSNVKNCHYVGWVDAAQIQQALKFSDVGLAPYINSPNYTKNLPNKPAEYMSGGLLILTGLNFGPLVALLENANAGFSYAGSTTRLVDCIKKLEQNRPLVKEMGENAAEFYHSNLRADRVYDQWIEKLEAYA